MSSDFDEIIKQGYVKVKSKTIGSWNKRWIILKKASSKGGKRLEKFQDEKASYIQKEDPKPIMLSHVRTVSRLPNDVKKHALALVFNDGSSRQLAWESDLDADDWHENLVRECRRGTVAGPDIDILSNGTSGSENEELFNVYLLPSPNLDIFGECILQVSIEHINIWDATNTDKKLVSWPLTALRRYGKDESKFTLEAGRHCDTGQGLFIFNTTKGQRIHQKVHSASVAIAEAHRMVNKQQQEQTVSPNRPPVLRINSDRSPTTETHKPVQQSVSYPGDRAPLPLPRTVGGTFPPLPPPDPNRKPLTDYMQEVDVSTQFNVQYPVTPPTSPSIPTERPPPPQQHSPTAMDKPDNNNTDDLYVYEEKYLTPQFREFLSRRKEDE